MWAYLPMQLLILVAHTLSSLTIELWWTLLNMVKLHTNNGFFHLDVSMYPPSNIIYHSPDHYKRYIEIDGRKELQLENVNCEWGPTLPSPPVTSGTKHQAMPSINISPSHQKCKVHLRLSFWLSGREGGGCKTLLLVETSTWLGSMLALVSQSSSSSIHFLLLDTHLQGEENSSYNYQVIFFLSSSSWTAADGKTS